MKTIKVFFLGCFTFLATIGVAQTEEKTQTPTVVYLKNGEVYKGNMLNYKRGEYLVLELRNKSIDTIPDAEISRIVQMEGTLETTATDNKKSKPVYQRPKRNKTYRFKEKGWYNVTGFSGYVGSGEDGIKMGFGMSMIVGYLFRREFGVGIGIGKDHYSARQGEGLLPLFIEARGYLTKKFVAPYYSAKIGYSFAFTNEKFGITKAEGGMILSPALGVRLGGDKTGNIYFELGYKFQKQFIERTSELTTDATVIDAFYKRIVFSTGIIF